MPEPEGFLDINIYSPEKQGKSDFDGGRVTEIKPIGFPGDGSVVRRVGPLFYWSWVSVKGKGKIPTHRHYGFESLRYILQGEIAQYDKRGTKHKIKTGAVIVSPHESDVFDELGSLGGDSQFFEIWFEPSLTSKRKPNYGKSQDEDFPFQEAEGVTVKSIIGEGGPLAVITVAKFRDITLERGRFYKHLLPGGNSLVVVTANGKGVWYEAESCTEVPFDARDFTVINARKHLTLTVKASEVGALRLATIEVPTIADYRVYPAS
jgi:redox-sensitive bicupin YhaK (pirin superfamily)